MHDLAQLEAAIRAAQAQRNDDVVELQSWIDSGLAWRLEGSVGRSASAAVMSGACFLPETAHRDFWGYPVPARSELPPGAPGTLEHAATFYGLA